jgi:hypothetical protein
MMYAFGQLVFGSQVGYHPIAAVQGLVRRAACCGGPLLQYMGVPTQVWVLLPLLQGARLGTFVYLVILHLLVVGSLMRMTHHSSQALYGHQQAILDNSRHDFTAALHHEPVAAAAQAVAGLVKGTAEKDSRLP